MTNNVKPKEPIRTACRVVGIVSDSMFAVESRCNSDCLVVNRYRDPQAGVY